MRLLGLAVLAMIVAQPANAQNFSCSMGKRAACLDYGDKVCSNYAKCVNESASCFDSYQCNYEGFTCKSNVTECFEKHDGLVQDYNALLEKHRTLALEYDEILGKNNRLVRDYNDLLGDQEDLLNAAKTIEGALASLKDCLAYADDLDAAKLCGLY